MGQVRRLTVRLRRWLRNRSAVRAAPVFLLSHLHPAPRPVQALLHILRCHLASPDHLTNIFIDDRFPDQIVLTTARECSRIRLTTALETRLGKHLPPRFQANLLEFSNFPKQDGSAAARAFLMPVAPLAVMLGKSSTELVELCRLAAQPSEGPLLETIEAGMDGPRSDRLRLYESLDLMIPEEIKEHIPQYASLLARITETALQRPTLQRPSLPQVADDPDANILCAFEALCAELGLAAPVVEAAEMAFHDSPGRLRQKAQAAKQAISTMLQEQAQQRANPPPISPPATRQPASLLPALAGIAAASAKTGPNAPSVTPVTNAARTPPGR